MLTWYLGAFQFWTIINNVMMAISVEKILSTFQQWFKDKLLKGDLQSQKIFRFFLDPHRLIAFQKRKPIFKSNIDISAHFVWRGCIFNATWNYFNCHSILVSVAARFSHQAERLTIHNICISGPTLGHNNLQMDSWSTYLNCHHFFPFFLPS